MQQIKPFSSGKLFLSVCLFALLAALAIVPWRAVAQESKARDDTKSSAAAATKTSELAGGKLAELPDDLANASPEALKKLLVGTWQGGHYYDELVLKEDGTFERFSRFWYFTARRGASARTTKGTAAPAETPPETPAFQDRYEKGNWKLGKQDVADADGKKMQATTLTLDSTIDAYNVPLWRSITGNTPRTTPFRQAERTLRPSTTDGSPPLNYQKAAESAAKHNVFSIERLDNSLLRLRTLEGRIVTLSWRTEGAAVIPETSPTLFFRRELAGPPTGSDVPQEVRRLAEMARLTADETEKMAVMIAARQRMEGIRPADSRRETIEPKNVKLIERIVAARRHQIGFSELFELTAEEAAAFRELMRLADDRYSTAVTLTKTAGNLSPVEMAAMQKLSAFQQDFNAVRTQISNLNLRSGGFGGENGPGPREEQNAVRQKLNTFLSDLDSWLSKSMFNWRPLP